MVQNLTINGRNVVGKHGIKTWDHGMVGADKTTDLWLLPCLIYCCYVNTYFNKDPLNIY